MIKIFSIPILFLIAFLAILYGVLPQYQEFVGLEQDILVKQDKLEEYNQNYIVLAQTQENLKGFSDSLIKIGTAIPDEMSFASLVNFLQGQAYTHGLIMASVGESLSTARRFRDQEQEEANQGPETSTVQLTLVGSLDSFSNFLESIEMSSRLIQVDSFISSIETGDEIEASLPEISLTLKVYYQE